MNEKVEIVVNLWKSIHPGKELGNYKRNVEERIFEGYRSEDFRICFENTQAEVLGAATSKKVMQHVCIYDVDVSKEDNLIMTLAKDYFNRRIKKFSLDQETNRRILNSIYARFNEGFKEDDLNKVIRYYCFGEKKLSIDFAICRKHFYGHHNDCVYADIEEEERYRERRRTAEQEVEE